MELTHAAGERLRRLGDENAASNSTRPFRVHRWRAIDNFTLTQDSGTHNTLDRRPPADRESESVDTCNEIPLPADHKLISLIAYNVCRAIISNKQALGRAFIFLDIGGNPTLPLPTESASECGVAIIRPAVSNLIPCLLPTLLQMNCLHPTWMDVFPFPKMRDNLIRGQHSFDHKSFFQDVVGTSSSLEPPCTRPPQEIMMTMSSPWREHSNTTISYGNGLILWGEPHLMESWEVTPHFLVKWEWVFQGCREIVEVSNIWRMTRGDSLLADVT